MLKISAKDMDTKVKLAEIYLNQGKNSEAEYMLKGV